MSQYITSECLEKLKQELEHRKGVLREGINKKIAESKELGDLSENAEYAEAKEMQSMNEGRVAELEEAVKMSVLVEHTTKQDTVTVGSTVKVKSPSGERTFTIVGTNEVDPIKGLISGESPIGKALMGHKKGDKIDILTPSGKVKYKILEVK